MCNNKQSSVDFLKIQFEKYLNWKSNPVFDENCFDGIELMKSFEQAKEMHEKETINFAQTWAAGCVNKEHLEYFYNETFGCNNEENNQNNHETI